MNVLADVGIVVHHAFQQCRQIQALDVFIYRFPMKEIQCAAKHALHFIQVADKSLAQTGVVKHFAA